MKLEAKPGFDWSRVRWDDANEPVRDNCSYCSAPIPEDAVPLRMWNECSDGCVFCDACSADIFGLQTFGEPFDGEIDELP